MYSLIGQGESYMAYTDSQSSFVGVKQKGLGVSLGFAGSLRFLYIQRVVPISSIPLNLSRNELWDHTNNLNPIFHFNLGSSEACFLRGQCFCAKYLMKNFLHSYQNSSSMCEEIPFNLVKEVFTAINIFTTDELVQLATDVLSIILSGFILQSSKVAHTDSKNKTTGRVVSLL